MFECKAIGYQDIMISDASIVIQRNPTETLIGSRPAWTSFSSSPAHRLSHTFLFRSTSLSLSTLHSLSGNYPFHFGKFITYIHPTWSLQGRLHHLRVVASPILQPPPIHRVIRIPRRLISKIPTPFSRLLRGTRREKGFKV